MKNRNSTRRFRKRYLIIGLALAVLIWAIVSDLTQSMSVQTAAVSEGPIKAYVEERARTSLPHIYHVTMPLPGRIFPIEVEEGDRVEEGQVVANLEDLDWLDAATSADEMLVAMENAVAAAKAEIKANEARITYTEWVRKAMEDAVAANAMSEKENQEAVWEYLDAVVKREESEANYFATNAFYAMTKLLPGMVERNLVRTRIQSPVSGVVLKRHVANEKTMMAGEAILDLGNLDELQVTADLLTEEAVRVQAGDRVEIFGEALGIETIPGVVRRVEPEAFTKLSSLGVEQQRVAVDIDFGSGILAGLEEAGRTLGLNYRVRVRVVTDEKEKVLVIPRTALFRGKEGGWEAFEVDGGRARRVSLEVGLLNDFEAEVLSGLSAGDRVVVAPDASLEEGVRVKG